MIVDFAGRRGRSRRWRIRHAKFGFDPPGRVLQVVAECPDGGGRRDDMRATYKCGSRP